MEWDKFQKFIDETDSHLINNYGAGKSAKDRVLGRTVKLSEEVGELANEVLSLQGDQRDDKEKGTKDNLVSEIADVIIVAMLIAKSAGVDIGSALRKTMQKVKERNRENK